MTTLTIPSLRIPDSPPDSIPEAPRSINFGKNNNKNKLSFGSTDDGLKLREKIEKFLQDKGPHKPELVVFNRKNKNNNNKVTSRPTFFTKEEEENKTEIEVTTETQKEVEDEETQPFTVVRVSSSVSQVCRPLHSPVNYF